MVFVWIVLVVTGLLILFVVGLCEDEANGEKE